ncbi:cell adhesion molecule CEACAM1-like [Mytilus edulis]|uniref:cell adhesion molecule CEACAM1-like n=1 Tax=Mytilus edulis TaxID=6550 RepID=UPI0039F10E0F
MSPNGNYLEGRVTLKNLLLSENRTVVEYNLITCQDNTAYRCDVESRNPHSELASNSHSIEVKGTPNKPDTIPIRTPDFKVCPGMNVNFSCTGNIGAPPGYFKWTKISNGYITIYNDTSHVDTQGEYPYEYTEITKEPDINYYDPTTPFIELTCFAQGCNLPNYTWYKDTDLNTTIGNDSLYRISSVEIENSGNYICIVETIINGTEEQFNQTVTIDIRNPEQPEQLPIEGVGFADTAAGLATIAVVSVGGAVLTSIFLFKIIQKVKHLRMLKTIGVKDVETVNNAEPDNEATQGIDDEGFVSEVSQQWQNNAPIQSTM